MQARKFIGRAQSVSCKMRSAPTADDRSMAHRNNQNGTVHAKPYTLIYVTPA